ncbi:MAG: sugar phosphate isomerase/epimerase [Pseudomonadota bacterium]
MPPFTYQLYSSRKFGPVEAVLRRVADLGFARVEGYGALVEIPQAADSLALALEETGLTMPTAHIGLDQVEETPALVISAAQTLGLETVVIPYLEDRPADAQGWSALGARVAHAADPLRAAGLTVGWHNHDFELVDLGGEQRPLDLLLAADPPLVLELDVGWVARAGLDPAAWVARHRSKLAAVHLKDVAAPGANGAEDGWADLGHGTLDWPGIVAALGTTGVGHWVMEHDNPSDDVRFAANSITAARAMNWGE